MEKEVSGLTKRRGACLDAEIVNHVFAIALEHTSTKMRCGLCISEDIDSRLLTQPLSTGSKCFFDKLKRFEAWSHEDNFIICRN